MFGLACTPKPQLGTSSAHQPNMCLVFERERERKKERKKNLKKEKKKQAYYEELMDHGDFPLDFFILF